MKEEERRISDLTKVIIKDLKGERIVYQDFKGRKTYKKKIKSDYKKINDVWEISWRILIAFFVIDFGIYSYFEFYKKQNVWKGLQAWMQPEKKVILVNYQKLNDNTMQYSFGEKTHKVIQKRKKPS